jgi:LPS sulfotransferase NodH
MFSLIHTKLKRYVSEDFKRHAREISGRAGIGRLPKHPYPEQFLSNMDCPKVDWATRFLLIASTPRCGSHYLGHMLGATGECGVPLEYLNETNRKYWARRFKENHMDNLFPRFVKNRTSPNGTFTLKAHWSQYKPYINSIDRLTRGVGFEKVIWISRRNQLSQAISMVIARQTGVWISGAKPKSEPRFDYDAIVRSANLIRESNLNWCEYIRSLSPEHSMAILYEDLVSDEEVRSRISDFLGLNSDLMAQDRTQKLGGEINALWKKRFTEEVRHYDRWILDTPSWISKLAHDQCDDLDTKKS